MFQRILVPLDDGTRVQEAVRIASDIALRTDAELVLVHTEPSYAPAQNVIGARAALQRQVNALRQRSIQAEYAVEIGSREDGILAAARDRQVDLILLVPAQRQQFELLWYARRATRLLNDLPAPLLIWPETRTSIQLLAPGEGTTVLVPLDGTVEAERSLPFAVAMAERYHRPLALVRALPVAPVQLHTGDAGRDGIHGPACFSDQAQTAAAYLHDVGERLERMTQVPVYTGIVTGEPGPRLLLAATAFRAGVVVLCTHSHQARERYFLGCVATHLLRQADVPVLVVPPGVETIQPAISHDMASSNGRLPAGTTA